jgi:allantoin racemase
MSAPRPPLSITVVAPVRRTPDMAAVIEGSYPTPAGAGVDLRFSWLSRPGATIESESDVAAHAPETIEACLQAERDGAEAVIIACFADPGLAAAREALSIPVVGEGEAGMHVANLLCERYAVLATRVARVGPILRNARRAGVAAKLGSVRPMGLRVAGLDAAAAPSVAEIAAAAVEEDGADGIVLSCLGIDPHMSERVHGLLAERLGREVPVIDPAQAAFGLACTLVEMRRRLAATTNGSSPG